MAGVIILLEEEASDYSLLTSHGISETRLLGEPGAEHAAGAASPRHPPPEQRETHFHMYAMPDFSAFHITFLTHCYQALT